MIIPDSEVDCSDLFRAYFAGEKSLFSPPEESLYGASSVKSGEEPSKFDNVLGLPMAATGYFIMDSNNFNSNNMDLGKHGNEGQFDVLSGLWDDLKVFDGLNGDLDVDGLAPLGDGGDVDWSVYYQQDWNNFTVEYGQDYGGPQPASISSFVLPGPSQSAAVMEDYAIQSTPVSVVIKEEQPNGHYEQLGPFTGTPVLEDVKGMVLLRFFFYFWVIIFEVGVLFLVAEDFGSVLHVFFALALASPSCPQSIVFFQEMA